jgi:hypothetical protein
VRTSEPARLVGVRLLLKGSQASAIGDAAYGRF